LTDVQVMDRIAARIREGKNFLVSSHIRIDGDGIASALAVDLLLRALGKKSLVMTHGRIPHIFRFLPGADRAVNLEASPDARPPHDVDTFFIVDVADAVRLGGVRQRVPREVFTVSIDHHRTGDLDADLDYCDAGASSTGELIHLLCVRGGFEVTPDVATALYTAILSDTQGFSLPNTTPNALHVAAEMVACGADPGFIGDRVYRSRRPGQLALWAEVASRLQLAEDGRLAWTSLTDEMLERHGVHPDDTQDLSDVARTLVGVEVGVLFRERPARRGIRVSLRSNHIPVLAVAEKFAGGGHDLACGCELEGTLEEVQKTVLDEVRKLLGPARAPGGETS